MRQITFIINPTAGRSRNLDRVVRRACPGTEILLAERPGQARAWARERRDDEQRVVVAVGGDGTVHGVGNGLAGGRALLGVWPAGSGNDFAKMLRTPPEIRQMAAFFGESPYRRIDLGRVRIVHEGGAESSRWFLNGLGIGFEAVVAAAARRLRLVGGSARYLAAALTRLPRYRPGLMVLRHDKVTVEARQLLVSVGNGRCAGGGFRLTPDAEIDDGWLDLCRADDLPLWRLLPIVPAVLLGRHGGFRGVHTGRIRSLSIECPEGVGVHADGESLAERARLIEVSVAPAALGVVG